MKLTFEKTELVRSVSIVQKAVSVRTTMDILECILIDALGSTILLTGNDLDLGIQTSVTGEIIERGNHEDLMKNKGIYYQMYTGATESDIAGI